MKIKKVLEEYDATWRVELDSGVTTAVYKPGYFCCTGCVTCARMTAEVVALLGEGGIDNSDPYEKAFAECQKILDSSKDKLPE